MLPRVPEVPMDALRTGAAELGLSLSEEQVQQFALFYHLLVTWNRRMNLTAITEPEEVQRKHFLDALAPLPVLAEEVARVSEEERGQPVDAPLSHLLRQPWRAIDVGAGAGLPGLAVKIVWPPLRLTLLDSTLKKVRFMNEAIRRLRLTHALAIHGRAETFGRDPAFREQFDLVLARGVARLNTLVEYLLPFARVGGWVLAYKGPQAPEELREAFRAIEVLGGYVERAAPVVVPGLAEGRFAILIRKVARTPAPYPRERGQPQKRPIR